MSEVENEITRLETAMLDAVLKGDPSVTERYFSRSFVRVGADGSVVDVTDPQNKIQYNSISVTERQVRASGDTAVSVSKTVVRGTRDGKPFEGTYRAVRTWAKEDGGWKVLAFSTTPIANH